MSKKQTSVIYLQPNKIVFYIKDSKKSFTLDLPNDTVSDLDVVNREKLDELIDSFFQKETIKGLEFDSILVFSKDTTFEKDFPQDTAKAQYEDIQKFLDLIPFEDVLSNTYRINKKTKVVAVNKDLYDSVYKAFERNKSHIFLAFPIIFLLETNQEFEKNLDLGIVANKQDSLKQFSLLDFSGKEEGNKKNSIGIKNKDVRFYLLLGVFVFLLIILFILIYTTFFAAKSKPAPLLPTKTSVSPNTQTPQAENNLASPSVNLSTPSSLFAATASSKSQ